MTFRDVGGAAVRASGAPDLVVTRIAALRTGAGGVFVASSPRARVNNSFVRGWVPPRRGAYLAAAQCAAWRHPLTSVGRPPSQVWAAAPGRASYSTNRVAGFIG